MEGWKATGAGLGKRVLTLVGQLPCRTPSQLLAPAAAPALLPCCRTVRTWDVFSGKGGVESLQHSSDVLALAWRPDGKQLASATLDGHIFFWDPHEAVIQVGRQRFSVRPNSFLWGMMLAWGSCRWGWRRRCEEGV